MTRCFFSISAHHVTFVDAEQQLLCELRGGFREAGAGVFATRQVDNYQLEMLIYRIEEILESGARQLPEGAEAISRDDLMHQVCDQYLHGEKKLSQQAIETAFNQLADRLSYAPLSLNVEQIPVFCYFVFLREMSHHLRILSLRAE